VSGNEGRRHQAVLLPSQPGVFPNARNPVVSTISGTLGCIGRCRLWSFAFTLARTPAFDPSKEFHCDARSWLLWVGMYFRTLFGQLTSAASSTITRRFAWRSSKANLHVASRHASDSRNDQGIFRTLSTTAKLSPQEYWPPFHRDLYLLPVGIKNSIDWFDNSCGATATLTTRATLGYTDLTIHGLSTPSATQPRARSGVPMLSSSFNVLKPSHGTEHSQTLE